MALLTTARGSAALMLGVGASFLVVALWDVSNERFGFYRRPLLPREYVSAWLFDAFGHWGPRAVLITIGVLGVAFSFWLAARAEADERPSNSILSWTLILLVLSLLAFIVAGPLLGDPRIDGVLSHWRERYYAPATALAATVVLGFLFRWRWKLFRETGDLYELGWTLMYLVFVTGSFIFFLLWSWKAIFGTD